MRDFAEDRSQVGEAPGVGGREMVTKQDDRNVREVRGVRADVISR